MSTNSLAQRRYMHVSECQLVHHMKRSQVLTFRCAKKYTEIFGCQQTCKVCQYLLKAYVHALAFAPSFNFKALMRNFTSVQLSS